MKKLSILIVFYSIILLTSCQNATKDPDILKSKYDKVMESKKDTVLYTEVDENIYIIKKDKVLLQADKEPSTSQAVVIVIILVLIGILIGVYVAAP